MIVRALALLLLFAVAIITVLCHVPFTGDCPTAAFVLLVGLGLCLVIVTHED